MIWHILSLGCLCSYKLLYFTVIAPVVSQAAHALFPHMLNFVILARECLLCINMQPHKYNEIKKKHVFHTATYDTDCKNKTCKLRRNFNFLPTRKNRFSVGQCSWLLSGCLWLNSPIKNWALRLWGSQKDKMADENIQCKIFLCGDPHTLEYWEGVGRSRCKQKNGYHKFHQW